MTTMEAKILFSLGALFASSVCNSTPIFLDTPTAQIAVASPQDAFSENTSLGKDTLEAFKNKKFTYYYSDSTGRQRVGFKMAFGGMSDTPITKAVTPILEAKGIRLVESTFDVNLGDPTNIPVNQAPDFIQGQAQLFRLSVEKQGNPDDLVTKASNRRLLGNVAALASVFVGMDKLGPAFGSQMTIGSGFSESILTAVSKNRSAVVATDLTEVAIDFKTATAVQVRKIQSGGGKFGQVLIAYKVPLTPEVENAALVEAIVALAGADRTHEQIVQARQADFDNKKLIWQKCVQEGRCTAQ